MSMPIPSSSIVPVPGIAKAPALAGVAVTQIACSRMPESRTRNVSTDIALTRGPNELKPVSSKCLCSLS